MELDQGRNLYDRFFMHFTGVMGILQSPITKHNSSVTLTIGSAANFLVEDEIFISDEDNDESIHFVVKSIDTGVLFLDRPIDNNYPIDANVEKVVTNISKPGLTVSANVNNPVLFVLQPPPKRKVLLHRINISQELEGQPSDSDFGNLDPLNNGIVLRHWHSGECKTLTVWKKNSDIRLDTGGPDLKYIPKKGDSTHGSGARWTISKVIPGLELGCVSNDCIELYVQDDLSGYVCTRLKGQGGVSPELLN